MISRTRGRPATWISSVISKRFWSINNQNNRTEQMSDRLIYIFDSEMVWRMQLMIIKG